MPLVLIYGMKTSKNKRWLLLLPGLALAIVIVSVYANRPSGPQNESESKEMKMPDKIVRTDKEWQDILTPDQYKITRKKGTERAFTGKYYDFKEKGTYQCVACGSDIFTSEAKFDSGSGWPSFSAAILRSPCRICPRRSRGRCRTNPRVMPTTEPPQRRLERWPRSQEAISRWKLRVQAKSSGPTTTWPPSSAARALDASIIGPISTLWACCCTAC